MSLITRQISLAATARPLIQVRFRPGSNLNGPDRPVIPLSDRPRSTQRIGTERRGAPLPILFGGSPLFGASRVPTGTVEVLTSRKRRTGGACASGVEQLDQLLLLSTVYVTQTGDGGGSGTFRILAGNATPGETLIIGANIGTINLQNFFRPIQISDNGLTIIGAGNSLVNPHGGLLFNLNSGASVTFESVSITGGGEIDAGAHAGFIGVSFASGSNPVALDAGAVAGFLNDTSSDGITLGAGAIGVITSTTFNGGVGIINNNGFCTVSTSIFNGVGISDTEVGNGGLVAGGTLFENVASTTAVTMNATADRAAVFGSDTFLNNPYGDINWTGDATTSLFLGQDSLANTTSTVSGASVLAFNGGDAWISQTYFNNNKMLGGSIFASQNGNITVVNSGFVGNTSANNSAIVSNVGGKLGLYGVTIANNTAPNAEAVNGSGNGTLYTLCCTIVNTFQAQFGVRVVSGSGFLDNTVLENNGTYDVNGLVSGTYCAFATQLASGLFTSSLIVPFGSGGLLPVNTTTDTVLYSPTSPLLGKGDPMTGFAYIGAGTA